MASGSEFWDVNPPRGLGVQGLGFRVQGLGFRGVGIL